MFTVYITVKNVSKEKLYLWDLNVYPSAEFKFKRRGKSPKIITITEQVKNFFSYLRSPIPSKKTVQKGETLTELTEEQTVQKEETLTELTEEQIQEKAKEDMLKVYYYDRICLANPF